MYIMLLRLTGVVDVTVGNDVDCTRYELRSSNTLRVVAIQTIDIFIRGCYL